MISDLHTRAAELIASDKRLFVRVVYAQPDGENLSRAKRYGTEHRDLAGNPWYEDREGREVVLVQSLEYAAPRPCVVVREPDESGQLPLF